MAVESLKPAHEKPRSPRVPGNARQREVHDVDSAPVADQHVRAMEIGDGDAASVHAPEQGVEGLEGLWRDLRGRPVRKGTARGPGQEKSVASLEPDESGDSRQAPQDTVGSRLAPEGRPAEAGTQEPVAAGAVLDGKFARAPRFEANGGLRGVARLLRPAQGEACRTRTKGSSGACPVSSQVKVPAFSGRPIRQ